MEISADIPSYPDQYRTSWDSLLPILEPLSCLMNSSHKGIAVSTCIPPMNVTNSKQILFSQRKTSHCFSDHSLIQNISDVLTMNSLRLHLPGLNTPTHRVLPVNVGRFFRYIAVSSHSDLAQVTLFLIICNRVLCIMFDKKRGRTAMAGCSWNLSRSFLVQNYRRLLRTRASGSSFQLGELRSQTGMSHYPVN